MPTTCPAPALPLADFADEDGWVTFQRVRVRGVLVLVQKRDGCTRSVPTGGTPWPR